jgi:hypothetical protein
VVFPVFVLLGGGPGGWGMVRVYGVVDLATSWIAAQQHNKNWVRTHTRSNAPDDGQNCPKHVKLKEYQ